MIIQSAYIILLLTIVVSAQTLQVPQDRLLSDSELINLLSGEEPAIDAIKKKSLDGNPEQAVEDLAQYFKEKLSERFFFSWKDFEKRFKYYVEKYPDRITDHLQRAKEHIELYPADTKWKLPFKGSSGEEITSYMFQHLSRQHKMMDIAFVHFLNEKDDYYLNYFTDQVKSLNKSYFEGQSEREGNDVFEYFRAGYRVFNWIFIHNMFLASEEYKSADQLLLIKTLLYHADDLYKRTKKYKNGNHHTKGSMALGMFAILFREFSICDEYYNSALNNLMQHLQKEVNVDGFQFERSVHYHIGDIDNYYYFYYLAKMSGKTIPELFQKRFIGMFDALVKIALPDKHLPVMQDDTDQPWAEYNDAEDPMTLGSILFENPEFKYLSGEEIPSGRYWFISNSDLEKFYKLNARKPNYGSVSFNETGYYVMRNGWDKDDEYMIISAGLSELKPDHQHGDMLGIEAYADGNVILPNYQVRYFLDDFPYFKNSFSKNLALVDSIPQGKKWKGNEGGTGFGKWLDLPKPEKTAWISEDEYDYFSGTHNAYDSLNVTYSREILFVKDGFWIIKDNFHSNESNDYYQIWQGNYDMPSDKSQIRSSFANGAGLDIIQLNQPASEIYPDSKRGKGYTAFVNRNENSFSFITLLYPFKHFDYRLEPENKEIIFLPGSTINYSEHMKVFFDGDSSDAIVIIDKDSVVFLAEMSRIILSGGIIEFRKKMSGVLKKLMNSYEFTILMTEDSECLVKNLFVIKDNNPVTGRIKVKTGEKLIVSINGQ